MLFRKGHSALPHLVEAKVSKSLLPMELNYTYPQIDLILSVMAVGSFIYREPGRTLWKTL